MAVPKTKSSHRTQVLKQAHISVKNGRRVVPVPSGQKGPAISGWPSLNLTAEELQQYFGETDNIGWITGKPSGNLVDVDLDCGAAVDLAKIFLPATPRIHGRGGRRTSHYWYRVTPSPQPAKFADIDGKCLIELRSDGQQTLVPPSIHPNGKHLRWEGTGEPAPVDVTVLCPAIRKIAAGALLARHWPEEGQRHDAANAVAGMLLRAGWREDETIQFIEAVAETAGDDESYDRLKNVVSTAKRIASGGKATGAPSLASIISDDVVLRLRQFLQIGASDQTVTVLANSTEWPEPAYLGDEVPPVENFSLDFLPKSLRPLVEDVSERMQAPLDFAGAASVVALAGCVNRRARIRPKAQDDSWSIVSNLWGANVGLPGFMKTPILHAMTAPLNRIEDLWYAEHKSEVADYEKEKAQAELRAAVWREQAKKALRENQPEPVQPDTSLIPPVERRLVTTDATFEKLHEILHGNSAGILVVRDELTGWLSGLDREGREGERSFFLQAWSGDQPYRMERIGRGSIYVPEVCISLMGNIQPARLHWYLADTVRGGANDDGLFQRFQVMVWPDPPAGEWKLVDRRPNATAITSFERVCCRLANLSADDPIRVRFSPEAQVMFNEWMTTLEKRLRSEADLAPPMVAHLSKYRSLMPTLAALFQLADDVADDNDLWDGAFADVPHTQQAMALCRYLESHARRVYSCVISPECRAARDLGRHVKAGDLSTSFATRDVYLKGWGGLDKPERARGALGILEDAGWVRRLERQPAPNGGRPTELWIVNPRLLGQKRA